jgi:hypothetical protein
MVSVTNIVFKDRRAIDSPNLVFWYKSQITGSNITNNDTLNDRDHKTQPRYYTALIKIPRH